MERLIHFDENVIYLNVEANTNEEVITFLYEKMKENNYVKDSYLQAVLEREKVYPTGLPLASMGVAIPHTDSIHVVSPMIGIAVLKKPVPFYMMGSTDTIVESDIVMMLAITEPKNQIVLLERLMGVFQNDQLMTNIREATNVKDILQLIDTELNQVHVQKY